MDKLIVNERGSATISNDGATIMKLLDVVHPATRILVDIAKSQDAEVRINTTLRSNTSVTPIICLFSCFYWCTMHNS